MRDIEKGLGDIDKKFTYIWNTNFLEMNDFELYLSIIRVFQPYIKLFKINYPCFLKFLIVVH